MKIMIITELFPPYAFGGAERSIFYLSKGLSKKNQVIVLTPNYGSKSIESYKNLKIIRFPFFKKLKYKKFPGNFFYTNPVWYLWTTFFFFKHIQKEKPDIINVQGKYCIPQMSLLNKLINKPILLTIRDYQVICNYGLCLIDSKKSCSLYKYFKNDFVKYLQYYVFSKNPVIYIINVFYAIWGRISSRLLYFFAHNQVTVVLSESQKEIFKKNGFRNINIIPNQMETNINSKRDKKNYILFVGRLTPGKGVQFLIDILPALIKKNPGFSFIFIGDGILKHKLIELSKKYNQIKILGNKHYKNVLKLMGQSKLVIMPSVWPEPFGRVALEAISQGTPVIASNRGGLPEIVKNGKYGYIVKGFNSENYLKTISKALSRLNSLEKAIKKDREALKKFSIDSVASQYFQLYSKLIK